MISEDKNNQEQPQEKIEIANSTSEEEQVPDQQNNPPSAQGQIELITAAEEPDIEKAVEIENDVEERK